MDINQIGASYKRDGYYVVPRLLGDEECDTLKQEGLRVMREFAPKGASVFVGAAAVNPAFGRLAEDPRVVAILREIMPGGVAFLSDKIVFKSGERRFATPWHIDAFYWRNTRPKLSVWIPLDDVSSDNGTLLVVRGSHQRDWRPVRKQSQATNNEFEQQIEENGWAPSDEVICELPRGSAVFFTDRLVHASCQNKSGRDRYTVISTYHAPATDEPFDKEFPARKVIVPAQPLTQCAT